MNILMIHHNLPRSVLLGSTNTRNERSFLYEILEQELLD